MGRSVAQTTSTKPRGTAKSKCRRAKCSKLCVHLRNETSLCDARDLCLHTAETKATGAAHIASCNTLESKDLLSPETATSDEDDTYHTPLLDVPIPSSASDYATPCGKDYSFVLTGTLDPDVYKLCTLMYRKFLLDWINGKLSIFPEPFPPKMENLFDVPFPTPDYVEEFYWDEPLKPPTKKRLSTPLTIFLAFLFGALLKKVSTRWARKS